MRLYIIRHADPDYANDTITPHGHKEAEALSERMAGVGLDRIYTSPLGRARATASYTARRLGLEPQVEPWTQELAWGMKQPLQRSGVVWDYPGEIFRGHEEHPTHENWHSISPLGADDLQERYAAVAEASDAFLERHGFARQGRRYRVVRPNRERIAMFCHGGFGLTWLSWLLEIPLPTIYSGFWLPPTSVSMVLMEQQSDHWAVPRCIGLADTSHLYAAGLPIQPRGLYADNW